MTGACRYPPPYTFAAARSRLSYVATLLLPTVDEKAAPGRQADQVASRPRRPGALGQQRRPTSVPRLRPRQRAFDTGTLIPFRQWTTQEITRSNLFGHCTFEPAGTTRTPITCWGWLRPPAKRNCCSTRSFPLGATAANSMPPSPSRLACIHLRAPSSAKLLPACRLRNRPSGIKCGPLTHGA